MAPDAAAPLASVQKVQAHQDVQKLQGAARRHAAGNEAADARANLARQRHPRGAEAYVAMGDAAAAEAIKVAEHLARASARWPAAGARLGRRGGAERNFEEARALRRRDVAARKKQEKAHRAATLASHDWGTWRTVTRCRRCLRAKGPRAAAKACAGPSSKLFGILRDAAQGGHRLHVADAVAPNCEPTMIAFCVDCGAWTQSGRSPKLAAPCTHVAAGAGAYCLGRLRQGLFPVGDSRYMGYTVADAVPFGTVALAAGVDLL